MEIRNITQRLTLNIQAFYYDIKIIHNGNSGNKISDGTYTAKSWANNSILHRYSNSQWRPNSQ